MPCYDEAEFTDDLVLAVWRGDRTWYPPVTAGRMIALSRQIEFVRPLFDVTRTTALLFEPIMVFCELLNPHYLAVASVFRSHTFLPSWMSSRVQVAHSGNMSVPRCSNRMPVNLVIDDTHVIISLEQASFLIDRQKSEGCASECLSCHFRERYLRDLDPDNIESVLANEFQVTDSPIHGGEMIVGWVDGVPVIIPDAIFWDVLQLHELENEQIRKYMKRSWKFPISGPQIRMIFSHYEDGLDTDEDGVPIYPDEIEPPAHDGNQIETLPTTPVTARLGRPRTSFSMVPPEYSPRPCWNGVELTHPREVITHGGQVAPFYHTAAAPEPPTYTSCGPFEQPPEYELQHLPSTVDSSATVSASTATSDAGPSSLAQGLNNILTSSAVPDTLIGVADSNPPNLPRRNLTRLQEQSAHVPRLLAPSSDQKYEYTPEQPELSLPSLEQVIRYLNLPRLVRQEANYALLPDIVEEAVASMDRMIDDLVDRVQSLDFEDPRTPPPVPNSTMSSASLSDFPVPPGSFQPLSPSLQIAPAGRSFLDDDDSDSESEEVESVSYGDQYSVDLSNKDDKIIVRFCTEAVVQMLAQDDVAYTVLSLYPSDTSWDILTLMQAFGKMKFKRSVTEWQEEDREPEGIAFNVDPQNLDLFFLQLPDELMTGKTVVFEPTYLQLSDFTKEESQAADLTDELVPVVCSRIVQELLTGDSLIHRVVAHFSQDTQFDLLMLVKILRSVAFWRRTAALEARARQLDNATFPNDELDLEIEDCCHDLPQPTLQELTYLGRFPHRVESAKLENPELMQWILRLLPEGTKFTITLIQGILDILESEKKNEECHRRDEEARSSLSTSITTLQRLFDHVSTHETIADAEAQLDHPTSPTIFHSFSTGFDEPTSPSAFTTSRPIMHDELFLPTSPTIVTTGYSSSDSSHTSLASQVGRTGLEFGVPYASLVARRASAKHRPSRTKITSHRYHHYRDATAPVSSISPVKSPTPTKTLPSRRDTSDTTFAVIASSFNHQHQHAALPHLLLNLRHGS